MKKHLITYLMLGILASICSGCYYMTAKKIQLDTLILTSGDTVLICKATGGIFSYKIEEFRRDIAIPGITIVGPPRTDIKGFALKELVREMIRETPVDMVLVISAVSRVEREYKPYSVFKGWRQRTYRNGTRDGRPVYRTTDEPVYETKFMYQCVRTTYRLSQYDKDGELMGVLHIKSAPFQGCPEKTDADVYYDDIDYLLIWLESNISVK